MKAALKKKQTLPDAIEIPPVVFDFDPEANNNKFVFSEELGYVEQKALGLKQKIRDEAKKAKEDEEMRLMFSSWLSDNDAI